MNSKPFKEQNKIYTAPRSMPECLDLPTYQNGDQIISFWEMDESEVLGIHAEVQPPVWVSTIAPFVTELTGEQITDAYNQNLEAIDRKVVEFNSYCFTEGIDYAEYPKDKFLTEFLKFCLGLTEIEKSAEKD